ncbi:MAG: hypothetical protein KDA92_03710 [Planctomycetales bacterium]|nr:hypothetical protein [Planctomycetales bacterium]
MSFLLMPASVVRSIRFRPALAKLLCLGALAGGTITGNNLQAEVLVPNDATWRWLHPTDGKDPAEKVEDFHKTFFNADFDDAKWKEGQDKAGAHDGFGYGGVGEDEGDFTGVDLGTPTSENRKTAYLRHKFVTKEDQENLVLKCQRDDGIIVYIDGKEVLRNNVEKDKADAYDLFANVTVGGTEETKVNTFKLDTKLPAGEHVIAISLHNREGGSSDLRVAEISLETAEPEQDDK